MLDKKIEKIAKNIINKVYEITIEEENIKIILKWLNSQLFTVHSENTINFIKDKVAMWGANVDYETQFLMNYNSLEDLDVLEKYNNGIWVNKSLYDNLIKIKNPPNKINDYGIYKHSVVMLPIPLNRDYFHATLRFEIFLTKNLKKILFIGFNGD